MRIDRKVIITAMTGIAMAMLGGCGKVNLQTAQSTQLNSHQEKILQEKLKFYPFPKTYTQSYNDYLRDVDGQHVQLDQNAKSLSKQYHGLFKVQYQPDHNQITLQPTDKQVIKLINYAKTGNVPTKQAAIKNWEQFVQGVNETSKSVTKASGDGDVKLTIVDPKQPQKQLYVVENGQTVYDRFGTADKNVHTNVKTFDPFVS